MHRAESSVWNKSVCARGESDWGALVSRNTPSAPSHSRLRLEKGKRARVEEQEQGSTVVLAASVCSVGEQAARERAGEVAAESTGPLGHTE